MTRSRDSPGRRGGPASRFRNTTEAINAVMYSLLSEFCDGDNVVATTMSTTPATCRGMRCAGRSCPGPAAGWTTAWSGPARRRRTGPRPPGVADRRAYRTGLLHRAPNLLDTRNPLKAIRAMADASGYPASPAASSAHTCWSMALRLAVVISQAPGLGGTPRGPPPDRGRERLSRRLLGDIEVTETPGQGGGRSRPLLTVGPGDRLPDAGHAHKNGLRPGTAAARRLRGDRAPLPHARPVPTSSGTRSIATPLTRHLTCALSELTRRRTEPDVRSAPSVKQRNGVQHAGIGREGRSLSGRAVTYGDSRWSRPSREIRSVRKRLPGSGPAVAPRKVNMLRRRGHAWPSRLEAESRNGLVPC